MVLSIVLGQSVFNIRNSALSLTSKAIAGIQLPSDINDSEETASFRQQLNSGEIWLTQAPELKLHVHISLDPTLTLTHTASIFLSQAGEVFSNSEIWSDLGLIALFKSCNHTHEEDGASVDLSFGLHRMDGQSTSLKAPRIPAKLQNPNTAVSPSGVLTASLSSITISLQFEQDGSKQLCTTSTSKIANGIWPYNEFTSLAAPFLQYMGTVIDDTSVAAFGEELRDLNDEWELPHQIPAHINPVFEDDSHTQSFNKLLDIAFRSRIVPNPASVDRGIKTVENEDVTHLSSLAPAIFSRGYSEAMDYRSQFIPSIAKSMASLINRSRNPALQSRISALRARSNSQSEEANLRTSIKTALWRIAQKRVYNPHGSRYLSPLHSHSHSAAIESEESPMLDHISESGKMGLFDFETRAGIYDDDQYLGADIDREEFEFLDDGDDVPNLDNEDRTSVSMTMFESNFNDNNNDGSNTDMLDFDCDFDNPCTSQEALHENFLNDVVLPEYLELVPASYNLCYQSKASDTEMLTSDTIEENPESPVIFGAETMDNTSLLEDEVDDMLC